MTETPDPNPTTTDLSLEHAEKRACGLEDVRLRYDAALLRAHAAEVERLRRVIAWCRPRLKVSAYRETLDGLMKNPPESDYTLIVQSADNEH